MKTSDALALESSNPPAFAKASFSVKRSCSTDDADFLGSATDDLLSPTGRQIAHAVKDYLHLGSAAAEVSLERKILDKLTKRLTVSREDGPNVINIKFKSTSPEKAVLVANAVADTYLASAADAKSRTAQLANKLMQERLADLKTQAAEAEQALLDYKMTTNISSSNGRRVSSEQSSDLNARLAKARIEVAEAKARVERIEQADGDEQQAEFTQDNDFIIRLRAQYADLAATVASVVQRVGNDHETVQGLRQKMADVRAAIVAEQKRNLATYKRDLELAKARYNELSATISDVLREDSLASQAQARLRELESKADTLRNLHNSILQRFSETNTMESRFSILPDARIVTRASKPLRADSSKPAIILVAAGSLAGIILGLLLVFLRENPFGVFRTAEQVKRATGLTCVTLPTVQRGKLFRRSNSTLSNYALTNLFSRFTEELRVALASIRAGRVIAAGKVICVASCEPEEGKTTVAANLAILHAAQTGARTLLVDGDFHRQSLTIATAPEARHGLREALDDPENLLSYVVRRPDSTLSILPCPLNSRLGNAAELLGSPNMARLIDVARENYDLVVVEIAPAVAVADIRMVASLFDGFVLVVRWGVTRKRLIMEILSDVPLIAERTNCVVLNRANPRALKSVERYKGKKYVSYYDATM